MTSIFSFFSALYRHRSLKMLLVVGGFLFLSICFWVDATGAAEYTESELTKNIIEIFDLIFALLALVLGPMVVLAGWLLSPDWTMGDFFGLRAYFRQVWILVSNIVYVIFALMLLYMAIMQIFWGAESEYAFKKRLWRFLVGILLVPFTWLIVSWTLSFANQAVAAVLSIPMGNIKVDTGLNGKQDTSMWHKKMLPTEFDFSTNSSGYGGIWDMTCDSGYLKENWSVRCMSPAEFLTYNQSWPFFIIMIYAYNIFKIQHADIQNIQKNFCTTKNEDGTTNTKESAENCVRSLVAIVRDFWLSLIVTIFFAVMLIALCWVLLMRAIKMWIYIMLSPIFGLIYFTDKTGETFWEAGEAWFWELWFMQFFRLAMVPVLVSAVLSFWLLFVWVVRDNFHPTKQTSQREVCTDKNAWYMVTYCIEEESTTNGTVYNSKLIIWNGAKNTKGETTDIVLNFWDSFSNIIGSAESEGILSTTSGAVSGGISSVEDIFAHLILTMIALVFMFMGVKVAVQYDAVTKAAFEPFAKLGTSVGNLVAHSPSYLPLPHPAFAAITNPNILSNSIDAIRTRLDEKAAAPAKSLSEMISHPWLREMENMNWTELAQKFGNQVGSLESVFKEFKKRMEKIVQGMPESAEKEKLERQLRQADTARDHDLLRDIATSIQWINENSPTKFLNADSDALIKKLATSTTNWDVKARFNNTNQQYINRDNTISLNPSDWSGRTPQHSDNDFRTTIKRSFGEAGINSQDAIKNTNLSIIIDKLRSNTGIDFSSWDEQQLRNLFQDSLQGWWH